MPLLLTCFLLSATYVENFYVIELSDCTSFIVEDFFAGKSPHTVLECKEGTLFPLNLCITGDCLALQGVSPQTVKILQTCFIRHVNNTFLFSTDLENWKDFHSFFAGSIGVSLSVQDLTRVGFNLELQTREAPRLD